MKYRCILILGAFVILLALSMTMPAKAITRAGNVLTMSDDESTMCDGASGGKCLLVNEAGVEREIDRRVRIALETCRSYTKGEL